MIRIFIQISISEIMVFALVIVSIAAYFAYQALRKKHSSKKTKN